MLPLKLLHSILFGAIKTCWFFCLHCCFAVVLSTMQTGCGPEKEASPSSSPDSSSCSTPTAAQLFVIDPSFRDAFLLSNATPAYQFLWEQLPRLFVGTADQLVTVVEFMCSQVGMLLLVFSYGRQ